MQYRLKANEFTSDITAWQNMDMNAYSINLFNPEADDIERGKTLIPDGSTVDYQTGTVSGFIEVEGGETYVPTKEMGFFSNIAFYNTSKSFISEGYFSNVISAVAPVTAKYARVGFKNVILEYAGIAKGTEPFDFVQYSPIGQYYAKALAKSVDKYALKYPLVEEANTINILDSNASDVQLNHTINSAGDVIENLSYNLSGFIEIESGETYACCNELSYYQNIYFFNSVKDKITGSYNYHQSVITAPVDAKYVRVSIDKNKWDYAFLAKGTSKMPFIQYSPIGQYYAKPLYKSVTDSELNSEKLDSIYDDTQGLQIRDSINMFDSSTIIDGKLINNSGVIQSVTGWAISDYIPVEEGHHYYITATYIARQTNLIWLDSNKDKVDGGEYQIFNTILTAPSNAAYLSFIVKTPDGTSQGIMMVEGTEPVSYQTPKVISASSVYDLEEKIHSILNDGKLSVTKNNSFYTLACQLGSIRMGNLYSGYNGNPVLNFRNWTYNGKDSVGNNIDDVSPAVIINATLGANHGFPSYRATITSHGKTNTIIGTEWIHSNGIKYYPMRIVDADNIVFMSENSGTEVNPSFSPLVTGTLTNNGDSMTIESVTYNQLYPSIGNYSLKIYADDTEIIEDATYNCTKCKFIETYDVFNTASVLNNIKARAGQSQDPVFIGDIATSVQNIYQYDEQLNVLVITNYIVRQNIVFDFLMFAQAINIGTNGITKYYIPNSLPFGSIDLRIPTAVTWSSSQPEITANVEHTKDQIKPINRVIQYRESDGFGFALGYLPQVGVSKNLFNYTTEPIIIAGPTGKVYPHAVNSDAINSPLQSNSVYNAITYRCFFLTPSGTNRQSQYHFNYAGYEYLFVDYKGSMLDNIILDEKFNGCKIEVIEAQNAELKSDVYNSGILVNANYVSNETCYLIAKINT